MHPDPVAPVVAALGLLLLAGKLDGELATRAKQPAVLGELIAGIVLGNLSFGGYAPFHAIARRIPWRHALCHQRRHHRARPAGPRLVTQPGSQDHSRSRGD